MRVYIQHPSMLTSHKSVSKHDCGTIRTSEFPDPKNRNRVKNHFNNQLIYNERFASNFWHILHNTCTEHISKDWIVFIKKPYTSTSCRTNNQKPIILQLVVQQSTIFCSHKLQRMNITTKMVLPLFQIVSCFDFSWMFVYT